MTLRIGVLAPRQSIFEAHSKSIEDAYAEAAWVRTAADLQAIDGLMVSSGTHSELIELLESTLLFEHLRGFGQRKPILATGSAAILMGQECRNPQFEPLRLMDLVIDGTTGEESRIEYLRHEFDDDSGALVAVFDQSPRIVRAGSSTEVIAKCDGAPILVEQGEHMAATFHLERAPDRRVYSYFVNKVRESYWRLRLENKL